MINNQAFKLPKVKTEKGKRSNFYHTAQLYNLLAWDFMDQPTKTFQAGLAARLWEQGWLAECRTGRAATDLPASLDFYPSWPGPVSTLVADYLAGPFAKFYSNHFLVICFTDVDCCKLLKSVALVGVCKLNLSLRQKLCCLIKASTNKIRRSSMENSEA